MQRRVRIVGLLRHRVQEPRDRHQQLRRLRRRLQERRLHGGERLGHAVGPLRLRSAPEVPALAVVRRERLQLQQRRDRLRRRRAVLRERLPVPVSTAASNDLVDELVHQFSDPYAFFRELIQNSIDAGSSRIEVTLSYRPARDFGTAIACVQDWGEGMNRRIIEDYLLTKFRSSKENDRTKIGKYGIGFVSIFALDPEAVAVDTGRDGESWRVLFKRDRTYELLRSSEPFEGTRIVLHKRLIADQFDVLVQKSREAVTRWCRHSEVDVMFAAGTSDGKAPRAPVTVREEVKVDAPYQVEHQEEGLHVVVGPSRVEPAVSGFYNRGLTLLETPEPLISGVAKKVVSRTLEYTLTRDNVLRNEAFAPRAGGGEGPGGRADARRAPGSAAQGGRAPRRKRRLARAVALREHPTAAAQASGCARPAVGPGRAPT